MNQEDPMRPAARLVLILILGSYFGTSFPQTGKQPLSLSISVPEHVMPIGSELKVRTTLTNMTNHVITLRDRIRACDYPVEVRYETGNLAPETNYQRQLKCNAKFTESRNILVTLKPGESRDDEIILNQLFELSAPGNYSVQVSRAIPKELGPEPIKSNVTTITITN
jgi:hypothetical protein